jgi:transposase
MARRFEVTDEQWTRLEGLLPGKATDPGVTARDNRSFLDAVLWIARTGAPWRDLPERFGPWNSVFQRFNRWAKSGVWARVMETLGNDADLEHLLIDATVVRAHQHAAGARKKGVQSTAMATATRRPVRSRA